MDERETLQQTLEMAQAVLAVLEKQSAGYTSLTIPAHIQIQLDEKRQEVASLQTRLDQLQGRATDLVDNLQRPPAAFVGRKQEIARCLDALSPEERGWGVTIDGIGGIGKTALALQVAQRAKQQAWFDVYLSRFIAGKLHSRTPLAFRHSPLALLDSPPPSK